METGKLQSLAVDKGFGFIRPDAGGPDVFFHRSLCTEEFSGLVVGQTIRFQLDEQSERPRVSRMAIAAGYAPSNTGRADSGRADSGRANSDKRFGARSDSGRGGNSARDNLRGRDSKRDDRSRGPSVPEDLKGGFITKIHTRYERCGFISADEGGAEIRFEPATVAGRTLFGGLVVGDYVQYALDPAVTDARKPVARFVRTAERFIRLPKTQLSRHPRSRGKKPTWRP